MSDKEICCLHLSEMQETLGLAEAQLKYLIKCCQCRFDIDGKDEEELTRLLHRISKETCIYRGRLNPETLMPYCPQETNEMPKDSIESLQQKVKRLLGDAANPEDWSLHSNGNGLVQKSAVVADTAWVGQDAIVSDGARVFGKALIYGQAKVYGDARVSDDAHVYGDAKVYAHCQIYGNARVYGEAQIYGQARIYERSHVYDRAQCFGESRIFGNAWIYGQSQVFGEAQIYGQAHVRDNAQVFEWVTVTGDAHICGSASVHNRVRIFSDEYVSGGDITISPLFIQGTRESLFMTRPGILRIGTNAHPIATWLEHYEFMLSPLGYSEKQIKEYGEYIRLAQFLESLEPVSP